MSAPGDADAAYSNPAGETPETTSYDHGIGQKEMPEKSHFLPDAVVGKMAHRINGSAIRGNALGVHRSRRRAREGRRCLSVVHFDRRRHIYQVYPKMSAPSTGLQ